MTRKRILIGIAIVLASLVFAVIIGGNFTNPEQNVTQPWMFLGAFATYTGEIDPSPTSYIINATMEVTNINSTHVLVKTNSTITTPFAPALSDQTTTWIDKNNISFQPKGENLAGTYNAQVTAKNIGLRDCTVCQYNNEAINATYYIDKEFQWPLKIVYTTTFEKQTYTLKFNLNNTNINGLE